MPKFYIEFNGSCEIEAETKEEATAEFWGLVDNDQPLPDNCYEIDEIERYDD